jgi:RNA polymerase sigma factor (sigma-70 family)
MEDDLMDVATLAERAQAGDPDAFAELVRRYAAMVNGYALATVGDPDLADDATQQAFITAWRNLGSLRHPERFGGWLRGIARFECLHLLRQRRPGIASLDAAASVPAPDPSPDDLVAGNDAANAIIQAIGRLPDRERVVTVLAWLHGQSQRDVAAFLDLPVSTVNNRMRSARTHLRQEGIHTMPATTNHDHSDLFDRIGEVVHA